MSIRLPKDFFPSNPSVIGRFLPVNRSPPSSEGLKRIVSVVSSSRDWSFWFLDRPSIRRPDRFMNVNWWAGLMTMIPSGMASRYWLSSRSFWEISCLSASCFLRSMNRKYSDNSVMPKPPMPVMIMYRVARWRFRSACLRLAFSSRPASSSISFILSLSFLKSTIPSPLLIRDEAEAEPCTLKESTTMLENSISWPVAANISPTRFLCGSLSATRPIRVSLMAANW